MIALSLEVVADIVGGRVEGDGDGVVVTGPVVIDGREAGPGSLFVAFVGEHADGHDHAPQAAANGAVAVLGTRATELPTVVVEDPQAALQRLAAHVVAQVRHDDRLTVLALTGSQGKTSTKDLLAAVLAEAGPTVATVGSYNNELGVPLTALRVEPDTRYLVLEMGARGRGHIAELTDLVPPDVSVVLNVGSAHLGEFGSREAIAEAKGELVSRAAARWRRRAQRRRRAGRRDGGAGTGARADLRERGRRGGRRPLEDLALDRLGRPRFTLATAEASAEVAAAAGRRPPGDERRRGRRGRARCRACRWSDVAASLTRVASLSKWRMELHELGGGVVLLNDSYNANPESMRAAIDALASIGADPAVAAHRRGARRDARARRRQRGAPPRARGVRRRARRPAPRRRPRGPRHPRRRRRGGRLERLRRRQRRGHRLAPRPGAREGDAVLVKASRGARLDEVAAALQ